MSKFFIIIILTLILFSFQQINTDSPILTSESNITNITINFSNYLIELFSGIADNSSNSSCVGTIKTNRDKFDDIIEGILSNINEYTFEKLLRVYGFRLIKIHEFLKNCQLAFLVKIYMGITNAKKIEKLGYLISNESNYISEELTSVVGGEENFFKALGKIIKISFDIKIR